MRFVFVKYFLYIRREPIYYKSPGIFSILLNNKVYPRFDFYRESSRSLILAYY